MKFEEIEYEGVIESHIKIFMYLATKYIKSISGFELQDLIHEQKLACYQAIKNFDSSKKIGPFLYAVAENRMKSLYRFELRQKRCPQQIMYLESAKFEQTGLLLSDNMPSPEERYYAQELRESADVVAVKVLSKFEYKLYVEIVENGKTVQQLACQFDKTEDQIKNGISRMRVKMRKKRKSIYTDV